MSSTELALRAPAPTVPPSPGVSAAPMRLSSRSTGRAGGLGVPTASPTRAQCLLRRPIRPVQARWSFELGSAPTPFGPAMRLSISSAWDSKCFWCTKVIDLQSMEIDHVIPESLVPGKQLDAVLLMYGLPSDFNLNSAENLVPTCRACNGQKSDMVLNATPLLLVLLQKVRARAERVRKGVENIGQNLKLGNLLTEL